MQGGIGSLPGRSHRQRVLIAGALPAALILHLLCCPRLEGDTRALIHEASHELACLGAGNFVRCGGEAAAYPVFQMGPAMGLRALGLGEEAIIHLFAYVSLLCFLVSLRILHSALKPRDPWIARLALVIYLSGFVIVYSHSSFTEMAASTLGLALVASILRGGSPWAGAGLLYAAALAKETAAPFLLVFAFLAHRASRPEPARRRAALLPYAIAAGLALATHLATDVFKFGVPRNLGYLQPQFIVRDAGTQLSFFFGLWFSPTGGLFFCWPALAVLLPWLAWRLWRARAPVSRTMTLSGVSLALFGVTLGFSRWYAPFGWVCWGPRLLLPLLPASLLLMLHDYAPELRAAFEGLSRRPRLARAAVATTALLAFANVRVLLYRAFANQVLEIPGCITADVNRDAPFYFSCLRRMIWPWADGWPALRIYGLYPRPDLFAICALYCVGWVYLAGKLLEESRSGPR